MIYINKNYINIKNKRNEEYELKKQKSNKDKKTYDI